MFIPQQYSKGGEYLCNPTTAEGKPYCNPTDLNTFISTGIKVVPALAKPDDYVKFKKTVPGATGYVVWYSFGGGGTGPQTGATCSNSGICLTAGNKDDCARLNPPRTFNSYNDPNCNGFPCCV